MPIPSLSPVHLCRLASVTFARSFTKMTNSLPTSTLVAQRKTRLRCHTARYEVFLIFPSLPFFQAHVVHLLLLIVYKARLEYLIGFACYVCFFTFRFVAPYRTPGDTNCSA